MKYHELNVKRDKKSVRRGRGISSGSGKTAGRGTKGQSARAGGKVRPGFEGGQTPLAMRIPKLRGFRSHRPKAVVMYTSVLNTLKAKTITNASLMTDGIIEDSFVRVKVLYDEDVKNGLNVSLQGASTKAVASIQKAGGTFTKVERPKRQAAETKKKTD